MRPASRLLIGEQTPLRWLHAQHLEKIAYHLDAGRRLGLAIAGEAQVVRRAESPVSRHALIGKALVAEFFVSVGRIGGAGESARTRRRGDPDQLVRVRKGQGAE